MNRMFLPAAALLLSLGAPARMPEPQNRFGMCAHLHRKGGADAMGEFDKLEQDLRLMKNAGIGWVRTDFTWAAIEPEQGEFRFERFDTVVDTAARYGIRVLPILDYSSPWAGLAHENLDAWTRYVDATVRHFHERLRIWEVWNEENIPNFWKPEPNARDYARLLKRTARTIRAVDPDLDVMYGGTAGIPLDFIRETLEAGVADSFDIMAIHPYSQPRAPEASERIGQYRQLLALLQEFDAADRIWITEVGYPTHRDPSTQLYAPMWASLIETAAEKTLGNGRLRVAVLVDRNYPADRQTVRELEHNLQAAADAEVKRVDLAELTGLTPRDADVLIGTTSEEFPKPAFPHFRRFVKQGGLLVHLGNVPFYYELTLREDEWQRPTEKKNAPETYRKELRIGWEAWWTGDGIPETVPNIAPTPNLPADAHPDIPVETKRWLTDTALEPGDRFLPLVKTKPAENGFVGVPAAVFDFENEGAVLALTFPTPRSNNVTVERQAPLLARTFLTYLARGVETLLWYELRNGGRNPADNQHNFGIVDFDLQPKPAYRALQTLAAHLGPRPVFDGPPREIQPKLYRVDLTATDGTRYVAAWTDAESATLSLEDTRPVSAVDYLSRPVTPEPDGRSFTIRPETGPILVRRPKTQ